MTIRHPSLLSAARFKTMLKEFLYVWETSAGAQRDALSASIQVHASNDTAVL